MSLGGVVSGGGALAGSGGTLATGGVTLLIQKGSRPSVFTGMCTRRSHRSRSVTQGASG